MAGVESSVDDEKMEYENQEDANNSQASTNSADLRLIGTLQPPGSPVTTQPTRINSKQYSPSRSINDQVDQDHSERKKQSAKFKIKLTGSFPEKWSKTILEKALQSWCNSDLSREVKDECSVLNVNLIDKSNAEGEITLPIEVLKKLRTADLKFKENNKELTVTAHFLNETKPQNSGSVLVEQKSPPQKENNLEFDSAAAQRQHSDKDIPGVDRALYPSYVEPIEAAKVTAEMTSPLTGLTVPLYHYLYMHEAYRKELEQMEQQYGVTICTEVSVSFKPKVSTNSESVSKISEEFQELVQQHVANLKPANIPCTFLESEIMSETLHNLQLENKKIMMIMSARNCLLFGPQNVTDMINRRCGLVAGVEAPKLYNVYQSSKMEVDNNPSIDMDIKDLQTRLKMDRVHWVLMELSCKEQLLHLETKYGVSFHPEELQDNLTVKVRAQSKEGQHNLERHALRALMQLYQKFAMATVTCEPKNSKDAKIVAQIKEKLHKHYCVVTVETHGSLRLVGLPEHLGPAMADIEKTLGKNVFDEKTKKLIGYSGNIPQTRRIKRESTPIYGQGAIRGHSLDEKINSVQAEMDADLNRKSGERGKETHGEEEQCPICMDSFNNKTKLKCQHEFCKDCLKRSVESLGPICPVCKEVFGKVEGNQPDGTMNVVKHRSRTLAGYHNCGTIEISYNIPSGIQRSKHPNPGQPYHGAHRTAYLPDNHEGNEVLKLLKKAFDQKLIFTVGTSTTTGMNNAVTWNDIHHKTSMYGGPQSYGYPDPDYLKRVKEELKAKGIE